MKRLNSKQFKQLDHYLNGFHLNENHGGCGFVALFIYQELTSRGYKVTVNGCAQSGINNWNAHLVVNLGNSRKLDSDGDANQYKECHVNIPIKRLEDSLYSDCWNSTFKHRNKKKLEKRIQKAVQLALDEI